MLDWLYKNIGGKIKLWAKIIFIVGAITFIIVGTIMVVGDMIDGNDFSEGLYVLAVGPAVAWIATWILYAFGELVEKTCKNEENTRDIVELLTRTNVLLTTKNPPEKQPVAPPKPAQKEEKPVVAKEPVKKEKILFTRQTETKKQEEMTLAEKIAYALEYQTDEGMVKYLKTIDDERIAAIASTSKDQRREQLKKLLECLS